MTETEKTVRKFMSETMPFTYKANNDGRLMTDLANFYDWLKENKELDISRVVVPKGTLCDCETPNRYYCSKTGGDRCRKCKKLL